MGSTTSRNLGDDAKSEIVLWAGFVLMFLFGVGLIVAAGYNGNQCGTCQASDYVDTLVVVPAGTASGCPNGHAPLCPPGAKLLPATGTQGPMCETPSNSNLAPTINPALCPQCYDGSAPQCKTGFQLQAARTAAGGIGFQCVSTTTPAVVMKPLCSGASQSSA